MKTNWIDINNTEYLKEGIVYWVYNNKRELFICRYSYLSIISSKMGFLNELGNHWEVKNVVAYTPVIFPELPEEK